VLCSWCCRHATEYLYYNNCDAGFSTLVDVQLHESLLKRSMPKCGRFFEATVRLASQSCNALCRAHLTRRCTRTVHMSTRLHSLAMCVLLSADHVLRACCVVPQTPAAAAAEHNELPIQEANGNSS
jgi:hypothetical protein